MQKYDYVEEEVEEYIVTVVKGGYPPKKTYKTLEEAEIKAIQITAKTNNKTIVCKLISKFYLEKS